MDVIQKRDENCYCYVQNRTVHLQYVWSTLQVRGRWGDHSDAQYTSRQRLPAKRGVGSKIKAAALCNYCVLLCIIAYYCVAHLFRCSPLREMFLLITSRLYKTLKLEDELQLRDSLAVA